ncbi:hypothetical protein BDQ12DRAFT_727591 [Crucibulum laeve]|uniref:DUF6699 domain-containing protein n=1 Tax=Crucibulum laeve TaxID=68775 RepID=A0A5C3LY08_9AGAR|nr:hypothetical protein BDQ12DRAFT_727591 [Crucibulum laeve]
MSYHKATPPSPSYYSGRASIYSATSWGSRSHVSPAPPYAQPQSPGYGAPGPYAPSMPPVPLPNSGAPGSVRSSNYYSAPSPSGSGGLNNILRCDVENVLAWSISQDLRQECLRSGHLNEYATHTPTTIMRVTIPWLPGSFINIENPTGVTIADVCRQIQLRLVQDIDQVTATRIDARYLEIAQATFRSRIASRSEFNVGLKMYDCLGSEQFFIGLVPNADGSYAMRFASWYC